MVIVSITEAENLGGGGGGGGGRGGLSPPLFEQNWRVSMGQMYMIANRLCRMHSG